MGAPLGTKKAASRTRRAAAAIQKAMALSRGKAMLRAPICSGRTRLAKPICGAMVSTKKIISVPCMVTRAR